MAEKFYSHTAYNYVENNPLNMVDPDGKSGEAVIDKENKTVTVTSHFYFYGSYATQAYADKAKDQIKKQWNDANGTIEIDGTEYSVVFNITGEVVSTQQAEKLAAENGDNVVNNFIRIASLSEGLKDSKGNLIPSSYMISSEGSPFASSNSGLFLIEDLQNLSTAAHEYGHGLGWFAFGGPDGGAHEPEKRDDSEPGIMTARGTKVPDKYGILWQPAGNRRIDPDKRRVLVTDVQNVLYSVRGALSRGEKAKLGIANNVIRK